MVNKSDNKITAEILNRLKAYSSKIDIGYTGFVHEIADGIAKVKGLKEISYSELVEFSNGVLGVAINLEEDLVGIIVLGDYLDIKEGDRVKVTGRLLSIGVGNNLIGRVINPLGDAIDGKGEITNKKYYPIEKIAPSVTKRQPVNTPLQTGLKCIDSMIPIGRGQRELIIGDRGTGKTAIAIDTIINQKDQNVICIYVSIGQKTSRLAQIIDVLEKNGALEHTIVVAANASDPASLQYIAPYTGTAIGEYFMDQGKDVLVIHDDLTKHAWAYRQIALILRRPSGREAYPGDIFYLHSRLLERACRLSDKNGGGSLTALPIIETQAGDLSAYIPTNVISITDGQIFLESDLFYSGIRPAVNVGVSVSRVGGNAQIKAMKQVAGTLRLDLAQYRSLAAFVQFASDLDEKTKAQIERGARMVELLKQGQYATMSVEKQVILLFAGVNGYLDDVSISKISEFEAKYLEYMETVHNKLVQKIKKEKKLTEDIISELKNAITDFKKSF
ncbi:F0F1 ATP synthase subunit alpha [Candidatus Gottesmanbacteria bacterium CG11_big_fil_rev_8_21_14_0_20_37_11]|uniref:ATP synthase subunit alpha n=3 Tax=Candidatus Gottesmaniibacteriota TaxID=1752720 RepID=A0A2M7RSE0_9BACT|nr:MAG: F0F1 ATP synthase subunit alpha [Candidatus Gottesmanbacteria bacterium CG1_02_37_22]PIP32296.1 MAG: F0F1 ATP synthase subunit alpha [Candidatus Gottesmanbacteria bacterium CG23_combo_of_CG06-09_8_20_14_all_37_19]PIR07964.1 MAG: F0F1 ATP synthase subunit alpha [Candidatus Gottesmanbacteria bacterium CG11_big_fil_rev_8_21_14_0_20_37_11]PIZ03238.1 MAG: F0F1 ATP synthase subunit alpha [Candidatus Gottesmanbacteria bacterium CG_4_10_14_0_8_um_filter_37_24]